MSLNKTAQYKGLGSYPGGLRSSPPAERVRPKPMEVMRREAPFEFTFVPELHYLPADFVFTYASKNESRPEQRLAPSAVQTIRPLSNHSSNESRTSSNGHAGGYTPSTRVNSSSNSMNEGAFALISNLPLHLQNDASNAVVQLLKVGVQLLCRHQQQRTTESTLSQQAGAHLAVLQRDEKIGHVLSNIIQEVRQRRKFLLGRITSPQWEVAHHYHATALEHSLGRKQPNVIEVAEMLRGHLVIYSMARRTTLNQKVLIFSLNRAKKSRSVTGDQIKITYAKLKSCRQQLKYVDESLVSIKRTTQKAYDKLLPSLAEGDTDTDTALLVSSLRSLLELITTEENHGKVGGFISNNNAQRQGVKARFLQSLNIAPGHAATAHLGESEDLDPTSMDSNMKSLLHSVNDTLSAHASSSKQSKSFSNEFTRNEALVTDNTHRSAHDLMKQMPGPIVYDDENTDDVETLLLKSGATDETNMQASPDESSTNTDTVAVASTPVSVTDNSDEQKEIEGLSNVNNTNDDDDHTKGMYSPASSTSGEPAAAPPHITDIISNVSKLILDEAVPTGNVAIDAPATNTGSAPGSVDGSGGVAQPLRVQTLSPASSLRGQNTSLHTRGSFGMASSPGSLRDFRKGSLLAGRATVAGSQGGHVVVVNAPKPVAVSVTPGSVPKSAYSYSSPHSYSSQTAFSSSPTVGTPNSNSPSKNHSPSSNSSLVLDSSNVLKAPKTIVASSLSQMLRDNQNNSDLPSRQK